MPANLTPQYKEAEERFRQAVTHDEKLEALREMMALLPRHKGTEKLQADLRRRLAKLEEEREHGRRGAGHRVDPGHVRREGAGQWILVGPPNAGKSAVAARPVLAVGNKRDLDPGGSLASRAHQAIGADLPFFPAAAEHGEGLEELRRALFEELGRIRIYAKEPGKKPDLSARSSCGAAPRSTISRSRCTRTSPSVSSTRASGARRASPGSRWIATTRSRIETWWSCTRSGARVRLREPTGLAAAGPAWRCFRLGTLHPRRPLQT